MIFERPNPRIVVGYDGSPAALAAVEYAIDRALPDGRLVLVHAYVIHRSQCPVTGIPERMVARRT
jgi:nucleotide-binding universal stress UspA family protein